MLLEHLMICENLEFISEQVKIAAQEIQEARNIIMEARKHLNITTPDNWSEQANDWLERNK